MELNDMTEVIDWRLTCLEYALPNDLGKTYVQYLRQMLNTVGSSETSPARARAKQVLEGLEERFSS